MLEKIKQRLRSKTYWAAIIGSALMILDQQGAGIVSQFLPETARQYAVMVWPLVMVALREVTTDALADK